MPTQIPYSLLDSPAFDVQLYCQGIKLITKATKENLSATEKNELTLVFGKSNSMFTKQMLVFKAFYLTEHSCGKVGVTPLIFLVRNRADYETMNFTRHFMYLEGMSPNLVSSNLKDLSIKLDEYEIFERAVTC